MHVDKEFTLNPLFISWIRYESTINIMNSLKASRWNECVFGWMGHSTYVNPLLPQAKWYVLILFEYFIPLTCLKILKGDEFSNFLKIFHKPILGQAADDLLDIVYDN